MEERADNYAQLRQYGEKYRGEIEKSLRDHLPLAPAHIETRFNEAVEYALFSGGKRLRPVLTLLGAELFGGRAEDIFPAAAAVEFIHTSSLIFDDLPCMNNAAQRRGKVSVNQKFGEGLAILVAVGFLNASYSLVFVNHAEMPERAMRAHAELVECVGAAGLIGGQPVDSASAKGTETGRFSAEGSDAESIRNLKTSALMRLALRLGAILAGADYMELARLSRFAELISDAYRLSDDLLDSEDDDQPSGEKSFALKRTEETSQIKLQSIVEDAKQILVENFPSSEARTCLIQLTDYLADSEK